MKVTNTLGSSLSYTAEVPTNLTQINIRSELINCFATGPTENGKRIEGKSMQNWCKIEERNRKEIDEESNENRCKIGWKIEANWKEFDSWGIRVDLGAFERAFTSLGPSQGSNGFGRPIWLLAHHQVPLLRVHYLGTLLGRTIWAHYLGTLFGHHRPGTLLGHHRCWSPNFTGDLLGRLAGTLSCIEFRSEPATLDSQRISIRA